MTQHNDCQFVALRNQGFDGANMDMELQWLKSNGATSNNLNDAWMEFLSAYAPGSVNGRQMKWLESLGLAGSLNDRFLQFWCDLGGVVGPGVARVVINDAKCDIVVVTFNGVPGGALNTGVTYTVNGGAPLAFDSATDIGGNSVEYKVATCFDSTDVVRWLYTPGTITVGGEALPDQDRLVQNKIIDLAVSSSYIDEAGQYLYVNFNKPINQETTGAGMSLTLDAVGHTLFLANVTTSGVVYLLSPSAEQDQVSLLSYVHGDVIDLYSRPLGNFSDYPVDNRSTYNPDVTAPTYVSSAVGATGLTFSVTLDEPTTGNAGFVLTADGGGVALVYVDRTGNTLNYTCAQVYRDAALVLAYTPGDVADLSDNALEVFTGKVPSNGSTVAAPIASETLYLPQPDPTTGLYDLTTPAVFSDARASEISVCDYEGTMVSIPAGMPALEGARIVDNDGTLEYYNRDTEGALITGMGWVQAPTATNYIIASTPNTTDWIVRGTVTVDNVNNGSALGAVCQVRGLQDGSGGDFYIYMTNLASNVRHEPSFWMRAITTTGTLEVQTSVAPYPQKGDWRINMSLVSTSNLERITRDHPAVSVSTEHISAGADGGLHFKSSSGEVLDFDMQGCQYELGNFSTPPIPTSGSAATRYICNMQWPWSAPILNKDEFSIYIALTLLDLDTDELTAYAAAQFLTINGATNTGWLANRLTSAGSQVQSTDGTNIATISHTNIAAGTPFAIRVVGSKSGNKLQVGVNSQWSAETPYAGATAGALVEVLKNLAVNAHLHDCDVADDYMTPVENEAWRSNP